MYFIRSNIFFRAVYANRYWKINTNGKKNIYLTFDDGPHPEITPFVLRQLRALNAKATFFCIGSNVEKYPDVYERILAEGHAAGNHTFSHLNGWKTKDEIYLSDVKKGAHLTNSSLFRPPYGRLSFSQERLLKRRFPATKVIMWDVLSGDFDQKINGEECFKNVTTNASAGSIVVFHDSDKAFERLRYALPRTLAFFAEEGYSFNRL